MELLIVAVLVGSVVYASQSKKSQPFVEEVVPAQAQQLQAAEKFMGKLSRNCRYNNTYHLEKSFVMNKGERLMEKSETGKDPVAEAIRILKKYQKNLVPVKTACVLKNNRNICYLRYPADDGTLRVDLIRQKGVLRIKQVLVEKK